MVPPEPNNALLGIMAWHVFTKGNPCDYSAVHHQMFQWVMGDCGKNLHKIPWGKENFLRGLFTPVSAVPPMKLKINGEPYKGEVEKYNDRVKKTDLLNQVLNAGQAIYEFPTAEKAAYDPNNPGKFFSHHFNNLRESLDSPLPDPYISTVPKVSNESIIWTLCACNVITCNEVILMSSREAIPSFPSIPLTPSFPSLPATPSEFINTPSRKILKTKQIITKPQRK